MPTAQRALINSLFFFNDTATTEIYTLSLHDALPISMKGTGTPEVGACALELNRLADDAHEDRKSTRLNSSHSQISYAVFCLKKKMNSSSAFMPAFRRRFSELSSSSFWRIGPRVFGAD